MSFQWHTMVLVAMFFTIGAYAEDAAESIPMNRVLLERRLGDQDQRLVVTRGPDFNPNSLKSLKPPSPAELRQNCYVIRVELLSPGSEAVLLASRVRVEDGTAPDKGSIVLDALVEPGNVVLAMADGPDLSIWQIGVGGGSSWKRFIPDKPWTPLAAPSRLDERTVSMVLGRKKDGRLSAEVVDRRVKQHTSYEESGQEAIHFKAVRVWSTEKGNEPHR